MPTWAMVGGVLLIGLIVGGLMLGIWYLATWEERDEDDL